MTAVSCIGEGAPARRELLPTIPQVGRFVIREGAGCCDVTKAKIRCETSARGFGEEGYRMELTPDKILISTGGKTGIVRAKTTILQLKEAVRRGARIPCGTVEDLPRCDVRALVFEETPSMDFLMRVARAMNYYKLNVLCVRAREEGPDFDAFVTDCAGIGVKVVSSVDAPADGVASVRGTKDRLAQIYGEWEPTKVAQGVCDGELPWDDVLSAIQTVAQKSWTGKVDEQDWSGFRKLMELTRSDSVR